MTIGCMNRLAEAAEELARQHSTALKNCAGSPFGNPIFFSRNRPTSSAINV